MPQILRLAPRIAVPLIGLAVNACGGGDINAPAANGTLQVTTATSGVEPDPDGYSVQVDAGEATAINNAERRTFTDVGPGAHMVLLGGLAANCTIAEGNPRSVTVVTGETASISFTVTCGPTTGGLIVTTATSGSDPDPDGYTISIDGAEGGSLGVNATVVLSNLPPGVHAVGLTGLVANCQIQGDNIRSVTVTAGADASVAYAISCTAPPPEAGSLRISTATSGAGTDPNGYSFAIDGGAATPIASAATTTLQNLAPGAHSVQLAGLSANCSVQGINPRPFTVTAGATAEVSFTISCAVTTGTIQVDVTTSGSPIDPTGYSLTLDGNTGQPIGVNTSHIFTDVSPGNHSVGLTNVESNCTVADANPRTVAVTAGAQASVSFTVTCASTGTIQWTLIQFPSGFTGAGLWASSRSDLFVVGSSTEGRFVLHHNGQDWARQPLPPGEGGAAAIWGSASGDVYAVGSGLIWHYGGSEWAMAHDDDGPVGYWAIGGSSERDVFAAGFEEVLFGSEGLILHWDGLAWSRPTTPPINRDGEVYDVWGTSPGDAWAVGRQDSPWQDAPGFPDAHHKVLHYDGSEWSESFGIPEYTIPTSFRGVWASAAHDVFVVGLEGGIWHYDGSWSAMTSPTSAHLRDVWGSSSSDVFAVGDGGILRYDGSSWSVIKQTKGTQVWGAGTDVFVLTEGGVLRGTR